MSTPLLTTKLYIPSPRSDRVPRPRLIERLNQGLRQKLTLISAPAGFGKTTLVSEWLTSKKDEGGRRKAEKEKFHPSSLIPHPFQAAWLSLDEADNDPPRFLTYLIAVLQQINPEMGQTAQSMLQASQLPRTETLLTTLINEIATFPGEFALVLDDYHVIDDQAIHQAMDFLIAHLPSHVHLIITSRSQPPLNLSRLRGQGQLLELNSADLRFTAIEVEQFLKTVMQLDLSPADRIALEMRTEGWIAGLQLAGLSLQTQENKAAFITSLTGTDRYIGDYLFEEVLQHQSNEMRHFLLSTAVADSLCSSLCDAILGESGSQAMLERLDNQHLFIVPLDHQRQWYRYHHLFLDLLRHHLSQTYPEQIPLLHRRASMWFEQNDRLEDAIRHGLKGQDFERTADLIEAAFQRTDWIHREMRRLLAWFEALPETVTHARPKLELGVAWLLLEIFADQWDRIETHLRHVEKILTTSRSASEQDTRRMLAEVDLLRANHARHSGEPARVIELCQQALDRLPDNEIYLRSGAIAHLASGYESLGSMAQARNLYTESIRLCRTANNVGGLLFAAARLIEVLIVSGQLRQAEIVFGQVREYADKRTGPDIGLVYINIGEVYREQNQLEQAKTHLEQGLDLCRPFEAWRAGVTAGVISMARVLATQGHDDRAMNALLEIEKHLSPDTPHDQARLESIRARLFLAQGNFNAATRWAQRSRLSAIQTSEVSETSEVFIAEVDYAHEPDYLTLARVFIAQTNLDDVMRLLARLRQAAEAGGRMGRVIEIQILQALAYQAQGDTAQALTMLEQALSLAEPEGYTRIFVDEGESMAQLLRHAASRGIAPAYIIKLLAVFQAEGAQRKQSTSALPSLSLAPQPLLDPLTERELETLKFLATGLSVPEIAAEMVVAVSTLRTHIKRIYSKLDVHSRIEAIHRAQELNLL